jgi:tetratricopeptide (TPR) repeat protein
MGDGTEALGNYNIKAAEAYRLGLSALRRGRPNDFPQAVTNFNRAIEIEPRFVAAYARLFETYLMGEDRGFPIAGKTEKLNELSARLRELAPTNADTLAAVAIVKYMNQWQWKEAEKKFKEALETGPKCRMALTYYGYFLTLLGRARDARGILERADKDDPGSADIAKLLGHCEYAQRHYDEALNYYQTAEERNQSYPSAFYWDARANMGMTNYFQAMRQPLVRWEVLAGYGSEAYEVQRYNNLRKAIQQDPEHPVHAYWTAVIEDLKQNGLTNSTPYLWAARYVRVGEKDKAENLLRRALQERDPDMENLLFDECWDPYRREQWFKDVAKEVGLDPLR